MLVLLCFMMTYAVLGSQLVVRKIKFSHETGTVMFLGTILSASLYYTESHYQPFQLGASSLFYIFLPLILF